MSEMKAVVWTITNAVLVEGKGKAAKGSQPIVTFRGTITRSDSTVGAQKGDTFDWTPALKAKGYTVDMSGFDPEKGTGTIIVNGNIGKGGRTKKSAASGEKVKDLLNLI